jgi:hypothetical protein
MTRDMIPGVIVNGEIEEVDDEDLPAPVIDLNEYRKKQAYEEFWSDPCWTEPLDPSPNGG